MSHKIIITYYRLTKMIRYSQQRLYIPFCFKVTREKDSNNWLIKEDINPVLSRNELIQLDKVNPISRLSNADGESRP